MKFGALTGALALGACDTLTAPDGGLSPTGASQTSLIGNPDYEDLFNGTVLGAGWTSRDGYALRNPADIVNHAVFSVAGGEFRITAPAGFEHNQWWLDHAQIVRPFLGSGTYEVKINSGFQGSQQAGIVFQREPGTFLMFMLYGYPQGEIHAFIERFVDIQGQLAKETIVGVSTGVAIPASGPYYLRVTVGDDPDPTLRVWQFSWSQNGTTWHKVHSGPLEYSEDWRNIGAIADVGIFAGNQQPGFDAVNTGFDYFKYQELLLEAPTGIIAESGDGRVTLTWEPAAGATGYQVKRGGSAAGPFLQVGDVAGPAFVDSTVQNGHTYHYTVSAYTADQASSASEPIAATPLAAPTVDPSLPSTGLLLALDAEDMVGRLQNGQPVTRWLDASSSHRDATAGSVALAPVFVGSAINGRPALRFDGVDDYLLLPAGFENLTSGLSLYVVMRPTVLQNGFKIVALGNGAGQQNIVLGRAGNTGGFQFFTDSGTGSVGWFNTTTGLSANDASVVSVVQAGGTAGSPSAATVTKNSALIGGGNVFVPPVASRTVNYIGRSYWEEGRFQGDIAEIILYSRKLSAAENQAIHSYIFNKYGMTPPPLEPPTGLTAESGNARVTLNWSAAIGATGYRVQRATSASGPFQQVGEVAEAGYVDATAQNGTSYYYRIVSYTTDQVSAPTAVASATPLPPPTLDPALPASGLLLALDAEDMIGRLAVGQPVTRWLDASADHRDATVASALQAPSLVTNAINGKPALRFDGVDDYLTLPGGFENFTGGISLYVVMRPTVLQNGFKILALGNGAGQQNIVLGRAGSTNGFQYFTDSGSGSVGWFNTTDGLVANTGSLVSVLQDAGAAGALSSAGVAKNATSVGGGMAYVPPVATRSVNYIGRSYWDEGRFQGDIAEIILYSRALNAAENQAVRSYIFSKYGIAP